MTRLEPHRCDLCGELFYVPEDPLRELILKESGEETFRFDLCFDCKEAFLRWVQDYRTTKADEKLAALEKR